MRHLVPSTAACLALMLLGLGSCGTQVQAGSASGEPVSADEARDAWAQVLVDHVDEQGRIDFAGVAEAPADLETFVAWLAEAELLSDPEAHLADLINAYNALALYNVVRNDIPEQLGHQLVSFFALTQFQIGGQSMSLRALENQVIRPVGEERIHFALNCMVRDCPRLPRGPFAREQLDAQLEAATEEFFARDRNVQVDPSAETVRFNEILSFYTEDFLAASPSLVAYANRYLEDDIPEDFEVTFASYDWTVNRQP